MTFNTPFREELELTSLETAPDLYEQFEMLDNLSRGDVAIQACCGGIEEMTNALKGLLLKFPNVENTFRAAVVELINERDNFRYELSEKHWDEDTQRYKGLSPEY
ncbi:hypothetical protein ACTJJB_22570 [Chitinophaga sp. 22536]|uniref:hypothetical protein n=1 Tax=unclassified Chitinophaga TaxID=2619133 RepID=UPI003F83BAE6